MAESRLREVYMAKNSADAHVAKLFLAEEGITGRISGELLQGAVGELPPGPPTAPRLLVREEDVEAARRLISQMEQLHRLRESLPPAEPWSCPQCSESIEGTFDICWNCRFDRVEKTGSN